MTIRSLMDETLQDLRYSLRALWKSPTFSLSVTVIIALAIGGNTAMFTVIKAVLLNPLQYPDSDRLVGLTLDDPSDSKRDGSFSLMRVDAMRRGADCFDGVGAYLKLPENVSLSNPGGARPDALEGARVSANFLDILSVPPLAGRSFLAEEDVQGGAPVAMISAALWRRRFAGDPQIVGKRAVFNAMPYTIIGVLPDSFAFPFRGVDVWFTRPAEWSLVGRGETLNILYGFARLKRGLSLQRAQAELDAINGQYIRINPDGMDAVPGMSLKISPLRDYFVAGVRSTLWLLLGAVGFVLLIACANVAGLLYARGAMRAREFAVRLAVGAERFRLVRQLLVESVVLAMVGGAFGALLAGLILSGTRNLESINLPRKGEIHIDGSFFLFTILLSTITGILFGLSPSLQASRPNLAVELREAGVSAAGSVSDRRKVVGITPRGIMVVFQVALSITLLVGALLLIKSFVQLHNVDPGFQSSNVLTMKIALPPGRYDTNQRKIAFFQRLVERAEALPGTRSAAVALSLPTTKGWLGTNVLIERQPIADDADEPTARFQSVTSDYFRSLGIPLRHGREFTLFDDREGAPPVVIINESFARRFWPRYPLGPDPVGQHLREGIDRTDWAEIVGIVADVHQAGLAVDSVPEFFVPMVVHPPQRAYLIVHTERKPMSSVNYIIAEIQRIDPDQPVWDVRTMDEILDSTLGQRRLTTLFLGSLAAVALLLAVVGIYGVIAYSVVQRTKEIGIRRALGASPNDVLRLIIWGGMRLALLGIFIGLFGAYALTRLVKYMLFNTSATDPGSFVTIILLFIAITFLASLIPARRAARLDPMGALRLE
jgi:predicted permease